MDAFRTGFVYVEDCYAGTLSETEDGYRFAYDADYLSSENTSLDFVISEVLSRLNINSLEELKTIEPEAYAFIVSLENESNELEVVP